MEANIWNKDEWINDLIEKISVDIQDGLITNITEVSDSIGREIFDFVKCDENVIRCLISLGLNPFEYDDIRNYETVNFSILSMVVIKLAVLKQIEKLIDVELDFESLLNSNTIKTQLN